VPHRGACGIAIAVHPGEPTLPFYVTYGLLHRSAGLKGLLEPHGFGVVADGMCIDDGGGGGPRP
jgi:hypothetical protein